MPKFRPANKTPLPTGPPEDGIELGNLILLALSSQERTQAEQPEPKLLGGWKDIANYLARGVRTVQRYERQCGLPVHRPGRPRGSVTAFPDELDQWATGPMRGDRARLDSRPNQDFKQEIPERHRVDADGHKLTGPIGKPRPAPADGVVKSQSKRSFVRNMERHRLQAIEQTQRAREMIQQAQTMHEKTIEIAKTCQNSGIRIESSRDPAAPSRQRQVTRKEAPSVV